MGPRASEHEDRMAPRAGDHEDHLGAQDCWGSIKVWYRDGDGCEGPREAGREARREVGREVEARETVRESDDFGIGRSGSESGASSSRSQS